MAENLRSSEPGINVPHMHGSVDSGGGLVSFLNVSENLKKYILFLVSSYFLSFSLSVFYLFFCCWCFIYNYLICDILLIYIYIYFFFFLVF